MLSYAHSKLIMHTGSHITGPCWGAGPSSSTVRVGRTEHFMSSKPKVPRAKVKLSLETLKDIWTTESQRPTGMPRSFGERKLPFTLLSPLWPHYHLCISICVSQTPGIPRPSGRLMSQRRFFTIGNNVLCVSSLLEKGKLWRFGKILQPFPHWMLIVFNGSG